MSTFAQTTTYSYSTSIQYYTVPTGITSIAIDAVGAKGGTTYSGYAIGGNGGRVQGNMTVTPGQVLGIYVGTSPGTISCCTTNSGGGNGSGYTGGYGYYYGSGGGGCSEVRISPYSNVSTYRTVVAGGGGGGGQDCSTDYGGPGGGLTGGGGLMCNSINACYTGSGGTQTAGGAAGTCWGGGPGAFGNGGVAYTGYYYAGGGGAGWYGGGGAYYYGGGGGGSSYSDPLYITAVTHTQGYYTTVGSGYVSITPLYPMLTAVPASITFPVQTAGTKSIPQFAVITGIRLTGFASTLSATCPYGYQISLDGITWVGSTGTLPIGYSSAILAPLNLYVQFMPGFATPYPGNIVITGGGQPFPLNIPLSGTGVNACSSLPTAGTAAVVPTSAGVSTPITLNLTGYSLGGSITYQWQSSTDSITWTNIIGGVLPTTSIIGITAKTWFRCQVTCPGSGTSTSTMPSATFVSGGMGSATCTTPQSANSPGGLSYGFFVGSTANPFVLNGEGGTKINDNNAPGTWYYDYTSSQSVTLTAGNSYTATNGLVPWNAFSFQIWIDFNNNGTFDPGESVGGKDCPTGAGMGNIPINIPITAPAGTFRMRVVNNFNGGGGNSGNGGNFGNGNGNNNFNGNGFRNGNNRGGGQ